MRRNQFAVGEWMTLPTTHSIKTPTWPLTTPMTPMTPAERKVWLAIWRTPMAPQWVLGHCERIVAMDVRWSVRGETDVKASVEARLLGDALGMTPRARLSLRWVIDDGATSSPTRAKASTRKRPRFTDLHVVTDDGPATGA